MPWPQPQPKHKFKVRLMPPLFNNNNQTLLAEQLARIEQSLDRMMTTLGVSQTASGVTSTRALPSTGIDWQEEPQYRTEDYSRDPLTPAEIPGLVAHIHPGQTNAERLQESLPNYPALAPSRVAEFRRRLEQEMREQTRGWYLPGAAAQASVETPPEPAPVYDPFGRRSLLP